MDWRDRLPDEISDVDYTADGFEAKISIPIDDEGFFGRACPACERFFKMKADEWTDLPDDAKVTCPYCGERPEDPGDFMTMAQTEYSTSALEAMAEQFAFEQVTNMFRELQSQNRPGSGIEITVNEQPPSRRSVDDYVEDQVRRALTCDNCGNTHAVYGATAFCPVCGPRPAASTVLEAIDRAGLTLALEDALPDELREQSRAEGIFDKTAEEAVKEAVTLFEVFMRDQFFSRSPNAEAIVKGMGNVFQRLDDLDKLFAANAGFAISDVVDAATRERLKVVFQQRHVLTHNQGIIDQKYLDRVPTARQTVGQKLTITRADAEAALTALRNVVRAVEAR
jgi:hypothetical protein